MFTTDLALRFDPEYEKISIRFLDTPRSSSAASRKPGSSQPIVIWDHAPAIWGEVPKEALIWQDPIPPVSHKLAGEAEIDALKRKILISGLTVPELVRTAFASAATFRGTDKRGGANGVRIRLSPEKDWPVNNPDELEKVLKKLEAIQADFNKTQNFPRRHDRSWRVRRC